MTNEEKAREIAKNDSLYGADSDNNSKIDECYIAALEMARFKDEQLKKVCKKCEQHIIDSGKAGCAFRSLGNEYCWED